MDIERFFDFYIPEPNSGCWLWEGMLNKTSRYGLFNLGHGKNVKQIGAHRLSYEIHKGEIPKGMCICHKCDVRECVNPDHLFLGTQKDNLDDMRAKGREGGWQKASPKKLSELKNRMANNRLRTKLTKSDVENIRNDKRSCIVLGKQYGVNRETIRQIRLNKSWK